MARIVFLTDKLNVEVPDGTPLREAAEWHGASLPFGCYEGFCGTCTLKVRGGGENLSKPTDKERERLSDAGISSGNLRLGCQIEVLRGTVEVENA